MDISKEERHQRSVLQGAGPHVLLYKNTTLFSDLSETGSLDYNFTCC